MTAALTAFTLAAFLALMNGWLVLGFAAMLGVGILAVQWFCIDPPYIDERDLHGSKADDKPAA